MAYSFKAPAPDATDDAADRASLADCVRVFEAELDYVLRTLQRLGASRADAEDLAQEVFLVMWRRRQDWNPRSPLRPWLAAIAHRLSLAHRRRALREVPAGLVDAEDQGRPVEDQLLSGAARQLVLETLKSIPPKQRVVLVMRELDGLTMKEIARSLQVPLFTAYSRLRVARQRLARELRKHQQLLALPAERPGARGRLALAAWPMDALLAAERPVPPAPAAISRRVLDRISRLSPSAPPPGMGWPLLPAPAGRALPALGGGALLALCLAAVLGLLSRDGGPAAGPGAGQPNQAGKGTMGVAALAPAGPRAALLPPPRLRAPTGAIRAVGERPANPARGLAAGLVGYWRFDETKGSITTKDQTGLGLECRLRRVDSTEWAEGPRSLGRAIRLAGGGWVECPAGPGLRRITDRLTVAAWVLQAQYQRNLRTVVSRQHGTSNEDDLYLGFVGDRVIFSSRVWGRLEALYDQQVGRWFHLAVVAEADGTVRLYQDGREIGHGSSPRQSLSLASAPEDNPLLVGAANNFADPTIVDQKLNGSIDELVIYDRALDPAEIADLASGLQPRP